MRFYRKNLKMATDHSQGKSDLKTGLAGLGAGIVWIAIVAAFAHWLAL
jgi:hypothetical protein